MASTSLDELLLCRWDLAASAGVMRTDVNDTMRRGIPGDLGLVIQLNPNHLKSKRPVDSELLKPPPEKIPATSKLKTTGFNFTKAKRTEILSGLHFVTREEQHLPCVKAIELADEEDTNKAEAEHFVLVNVAPLVRGHLLFVFDMNLVKPQIMTSNFLLYALSISQAMQREDFALGFNSAGAWSSVNHFHLQGYFFPRVESKASTNFPVAAQPREEMFRVNGVIVNTLSSWKTTCYVVEPMEEEKHVVHVVEVAWTLVEILQSQGIQHNLVIVDKVVFIFPRQPQCENGVGLLTDKASNDAVPVGRLRIAVAELSGLVIAGDSVAYDNLTEEMFNFILEKEVALSTEEEAALVAEWKAKIGIKEN